VGQIAKNKKKEKNDKKKIAQTPIIPTYNYQNLVIMVHNC
jgi:hypothetical protein